MLALGLRIKSWPVVSTWRAFRFSHLHTREKVPCWLLIAAHLSTSVAEILHPRLASKILPLIMLGCLASKTIHHAQVHFIMHTLVKE